MAKVSRTKTAVSRQQRRTKATRERLLAAARSVFAEKGIDLARIDEIAERADVGKGTFYYHFTGKGKLVRVMIEEMMEELVAALKRSCGESAGLTEMLDALVAAHIEFFCNRWEDFVLYFQGRSDLTLGEGYVGIETPFNNYLECVESLLVPVLRHRLSQPVLRRIACAVVGFVSGYYSFAAIASKDADVDETFRSLRGAMVQSLAKFVQEASAPADESDSGAGVQ